MSNPDRWERVDAILNAALERPPEQRSGFLAAACADDEALRAAVERLLELALDASGELRTGGAVMELVFNWLSELDRSPSPVR